MRALVLLPFLAACGGTTTLFQDDGDVCIDEAAGQVIVQVNTCLSSSCDTLEYATCSATQTGDTLTITSEAEVTSQGNTCTDDCGFVIAQCDLPSADTAPTTVVHGADSMPYADATGDCTFEMR